MEGIRGKLRAVTYYNSSSKSVFFRMKENTSELTHIFQVDSYVRPLIGVCVDTVTLPKSIINWRTTLVSENRKRLIHATFSGLKFKKNLKIALSFAKIYSTKEIIINHKGTRMVRDGEN